MDNGQFSRVTTIHEPTPNADTKLNAHPHARTILFIKCYSITEMLLKHVTYNTVRTLLLRTTRVTASKFPEVVF